MKNLQMNKYSLNVLCNTAVSYQCFNWPTFGSFVDVEPGFLV